MSRTYTVFLKDKQLKITDEDLSEFADLLGLDGDLRKRISELLLVDLFVYVSEFGVSPYNVIEEIKNLENGDGNTSTKLATEFKRPPLAGLWHKHFFSAHSLVQNMINGLKGGKLAVLVEQVMDPSKPIITREMIGELSHRVTHEPVEERANNQKLTGEWIVFSKHGGSNYYLCLNTHEAGDQNIADRIKANCAREFPFITTII